jgi:uncharacterized membrane protein YraQ (UPF0718 family)
MDYLLNLANTAFTQTIVSLAHNWPYLLASILVAAALKAFVDTDKVAAFLQRYGGASVFAATGAAVATPFCSCGTTAVILGMMASTMPLAPIVAFMVASPLSSPGELFYSAGLFGWPFAIAYFGASIVLGLTGGGIAHLLEKRGLLAGQARLAATSAETKRRFTRGAARSGLTLATASPKPACGCGAAAPARSCCAAAAPVEEAATLAAEAAPSRGFAGRSRDLGLAILGISKKLLPMFIGFAFIGYLLNGLIPSSWMSALFGKGHAYSVPLAATIGLPLYVSSEASLPLVRALLDSGMSQGAIMAFLIAGSGTSIGAITGALTIARWKVVGLVVAVLWVGAIVAGYGFDLLAASGIF